MSSSIINRLPTVVAAQRLVRYSAASRCPELGLPADGRALHFPGLKHHWLIIERDTDAPGLKKLADRRSESLADMLDDLSNTSIPATPAALAYCLDAPAAICQHPTLSDERSLDWLGSQIRRREIAIHRYRPPKRMHRPPGRYRPTHVPTLEELDALHSESAAELDKAVGAVPAPELSTTESLPAPPPATIDQWSEKDMEIVRGLVQEQVAANPSLTEGYAQLLARLEVIGKAVALKNGAPVSSPEPAEQIVDATEPNVYKDPATAHCDDEPWRKAVVIDGVAQPFAKADGTPAGGPMLVPRYSERGTIVEREFNGKTYHVAKDEGGFPVFTIFETYLDEEHIGSGDDEAHFEASNRRLGGLLQDDPGLAQQLGLNKAQEKFLTAEKAKRTCPPGLTWHHHQDAGKMQLVSTEVHNRVAHVGGMKLWEEREVPKPITWEEYLYDEAVDQATEAHMRQAEKAIGYAIPEPLRQMMVDHGGQAPTNLEALYKNGRKMLIDCLYHAHPAPDEPSYIAYTPNFGRTALAEAGFPDLVPFGSRGNTFLCLDYRHSATDPSVTIIDRDCVPESPDAWHPQADSITEFFERYVV